MELSTIHSNNLDHAKAHKLLNAVIYGKSDDYILSLVDNQNINYYFDYSDCTILCQVLKDNNENLALKLLNNPFINLNIESGIKTATVPSHPMMLSCRQGLDKVALKIIDKLTSADYPYDKFNINYRDKFNNSFLILSCCYDTINVINKLLQLNCDIDIINNYNFTALSISCKNGLINTSLKLIKKGCNIDTPNINNYTALIYATLNKLYKVIFKLLNKKADVTIRTLSEGKLYKDTYCNLTFFDSAIKYNQHTVLKYYYLGEILNNK